MIIAKYLYFEKTSKKIIVKFSGCMWPSTSAAGIHLLCEIDIIKNGATQQQD
jgi:hypothetical protein